jgi:hypothetical protein
LYNAERFAQATLDSLKDPANKVDQQSEEVARGYYNLANVISLQEHGDLVKAEMLARESLRIFSRIFHSHPCTGLSTGLLACILQSQGNLGNKTLELFKWSLAMDIENSGPDGMNTAGSNINLGRFYHQLAESQQTTEARLENLYLSQSNFKEAVRIHTKILGPDNPKTVDASSILSSISSLLSET